MRYFKIWVFLVVLPIILVCYDKILYSGLIVETQEHGITALQCPQCLLMWSKVQFNKASQNKPLIKTQIDFKCCKMFTGFQSNDETLAYCTQNSF